MLPVENCVDKVALIDVGGAGLGPLIVFGDHDGN